MRLIHDLDPENGTNRKVNYISEEQIIRILKEHEAGKKAADIVREYNISEQTFYRWKSKYGGMDVSEAKHLKQLEEENRQLKELVANLTLDNHIL